ncbi:hypothetical protein [Methanocaldococcus villosus]|nr:hypothetical protein [Methanocaldococcus villosus]
MEKTMMIFFLINTPLGIFDNEIIIYIIIGLALGFLFGFLILHIIRL